MKVGIFSPYLDTIGGGERYLLTVAEFFQNRGDQVDIFWDGLENKEKIKERFAIDLANVNFVEDIFFSNKNIFQKLAVTIRYDLIFFLSDGSIPSSLAKKNILHFQRPFRLTNQKTLLNKIKLSRFQAVVCNSLFTKKDIDKTYDVDSVVLYPPVDVENIKPGKKENIILSVGRFFSPSHPKKQEIMIREFAQIYKQLKSWQLVLIGGVFPGSEKSVEILRKKSAGYPIKIITDPGIDTLSDYYNRAKIYWHAAGYGEDLENFPEKGEHFGITTVEAMSAGCVPICFAGGGQLEIIDNQKNGYLWQTLEELKEKTLMVADNNKLRKVFALKARQKSAFFGKQVFFDHLEKITG